MDVSAVHSRVSWKPVIQEGGGATIPEVIALMRQVMCQSRTGGYVIGHAIERGRDGRCLVEVAPAICSLVYG
ncbi:UNVERIFIED_CONTAM: hypothetical protein FKN15_038428 [Acipenser sinensis]